MLACAQLTVRDENDIQVAASAPATPVANELWLDTSASPALLKRWDGTAWAVCGAHEEVAALQAEMTTALEQTSEAIALKASQSVVNALGERVTDAESAITLNASAIEAAVSGKNRTYVQLEAPTQGLLTGDQWVEYQAPTLWSDADDGAWSALALRTWKALMA